MHHIISCWYVKYFNTKYKTVYPVTMCMTLYNVISFWNFEYRNTNENTTISMNLIK